MLCDDALKVKLRRATASSMPGVEGVDSGRRRWMSRLR